MNMLSENIKELKERIGKLKEGQVLMKLIMDEVGNRKVEEKEKEDLI